MGRAPPAEDLVVPLPQPTNLCTHTPRKSGNTIDLYTPFPWEALCAEMAKLQVQRHERGQLVRLPLAASAKKENPVALCWRHGFEWRRRESNPHPGTSECNNRSPGMRESQSSAAA